MFVIETLVIWWLRYCFIVNAQHWIVAGVFRGHHSIGKNIGSNAFSDILSPLT